MKTDQQIIDSQQREIRELHARVRYLVQHRAQTLWLVEIYRIEVARWERICSPRPKDACEAIIAALGGGMFPETYRAVEWEPDVQ